MFIEDITVFFREFSTPVTAQIGDGLLAFRGIFDDANLSANIGSTEADLTQPRLTCTKVDAIQLAKGIVLEIAGQGTFRILEIVPEGTGLTVLILAKHTPRDASARALHTTLLEEDDGT